MQINKQRLNQWLSGEIAAYNDGTPESIEMIKELCRRSSSLSTPSGVADLYANDKKIGWYSYEGPEGGMPHQPVSWFFEPGDEPANPSIEQRLESIEKTLDEIRAFLVL